MKVRQEITASMTSFGADLTVAAKSGGHERSGPTGWVDWEGAGSHFCQRNGEPDVRSWALGRL